MNLSIGLSLTRPSGPLGFNPASLFASGEEGAWYDPSDLTTLYQDDIGTTSAGVGDPVGLMLDKSKGLTLGSELVTNGTFDTSSDWTLGTGWSIASGLASKSPGTGSNISQLVSLSAGATYRVEFTVSAQTAGSLQPKFTGGTNVNGQLITSDGSYVCHLSAVSGNNTFALTANAGFDGSVDNISIRELPGNHATQSTPTARPTLQVTGTTPATLGSELVTNGTFDSDVSGWGDLGAWTAGSVAWNAGQAEVTVSSYAGAAQQFATGALGKWYRVQFDVVSTGNVGRFYVGKASNVGAAASLNVLNLAAGSYSYLVQATYDDMAIGLSSTSGTGTVVYDNISVQEVLTWADPKYYLNFDGVDDGMKAQYGTTLSDITRGVAYRADSDNDMIADDYDNTNYASLVAMPGGTDLRFRLNNSATDLVIGSGGWITGDDEVAIAQALSDGSISLQGSGNAASDTVSAPTGINGVTLGAAASGSIPLDGRIYGFVDVDRSLNASEIAGLGAYLAAKSGVTL